MSVASNLLATKPRAAGKSVFADDDVYPVHALDDTKTFRNTLITWTICFNDQLDAERLRSSLSRLLELGDWRKIGGRLRLKDNGALEIYAPHSFTAERPAFSFSHDNVEASVGDHVVAKNLPKFNGTAAIWPGPQAFDEFAAKADAPTTLEDLLAGDAPQISVHVTSFADATLIGLSWPHTLMDVMGQHAFLHGWSLVLANRETEVPPVLGAREDALCALIEAPSNVKEEYVLKSKQLRGLGMLKFGARFAWDMLTGPVLESRTVCLPKDAVAKLRQQAESVLGGGSVEGKAPFLSDGDLLTAWVIHAVASYSTSARPITALHALNARFRLSALTTAKGVYLQNMLSPGCTFVSNEVGKGPIGPIALDNRRALMKQATEAQVLAAFREQRLAGDPSTLLYSDSDAILVPFTDWTKAELLSTADFSPAVLRAGDVSQTRFNPPGTPTFLHASTRRPAKTRSLMVVVLGKDHGQNYWLTLKLSPLHWVHIETSIEELK
ncbi:hypothetical protein IQ07DRAFT_607592 [Pyrenochaeta sp. DS3sAY3a]|nr:hypothetical protein IQ07DRAFT_607592 [Pyrenochaeta sp. DS3sAY3a]